MSGNIYYWGARPCVKENNLNGSSTFNPKVKPEEKGDEVYLNFLTDQQYQDIKEVIITSEILGKTRVTKTFFDNPDGTPLKVDKDYFGNSRSAENAVAGPFVNLEQGNQNLKIW